MPIGTKVRRYKAECRKFISRNLRSKFTNLRKLGIYGSDVPTNPQSEKLSLAAMEKRVRLGQKLAQVKVSEWTKIVSKGISEKITTIYLYETGRPSSSRILRILLQVQSS